MNTRELLDDYLFNGDYYSLSENDGGGGLRQLYTIDDILVLWDEGSIGQ